MSENVVATLLSVLLGSVFGAFRSARLARFLHREAVFVSVREFGALRRALPADVFAKGAEVPVMLGAARECRQSGGADVGAVQVEQEAPRRVRRTLADVGGGAGLTFM